ncbi:hypothetical protein [Paraburkholderia sp. BR10882]|uniref:hypothetical protein n=1 Tax=unclassified Paraburkholderia TaxID=2615204 RepID=UPI0034CD5204
MGPASDASIRGILAALREDMRNNPMLTRADFEARALFAAVSALHEAAGPDGITGAAREAAVRAGVSPAELEDLLSAETDAPVSLGTIAAIASAFKYRVEFQLVPLDAPSEQTNARLERYPETEPPRHAIVKQV